MKRKSKYRITSLRDENTIELEITESEYRLLQNVFSIFNNVVMENIESEPFEYNLKPEFH